VEILRDLIGQTNGRLIHRGPVVLEAASGGAFGDNQISKGSDLKVKGRTLGTLKWLKVSEASRKVTDDRTGREIIYVKGRERDNIYGDYLEGIQEVGKCQSWFCTTDTGPILDIVLDPSGDAGDTQASASPGDMIPFVWDINGVGIAVGGGRHDRIRHAQATGAWGWVSGYTGLVGQVTAVEVADLFGNTPGTTAYTFYLPATEGSDPNVQIGNIFAWTLDGNGNRVAVGGYLDSKIGKIDWLAPGKDIPRGWALYGPAAGRFLAGFGPTTDGYNDDGGTGGRSPIQPLPHVSGTPAWQIDDHPAVNTSVSYVGIEIQPTHLQTDDAYTGIVKTEPIALYTNPTRCEVNVPAHTADDPTAGDWDWVDAVGGYLGPGDGFGDTEAGGADNHTHQIAVGYDEIDPRHFPETFQHQHTIDPHYHMIIDLRHAHSITPQHHSHGYYDPGHLHTVPGANHTGSLAHALEDFRPPFLITRQIIRVGPTED